MGFMCSEMVSGTGDVTAPRPSRSVCLAIAHVSFSCCACQCSCCAVCMAVAHFSFSVQSSQINSSRRYTYTHVRTRACKKMRKKNGQVADEVLAWYSHAHSYPTRTHACVHLC
jgi:hypothetical protein